MNTPSPIHSQFTLSTPRDKLFISCATQQCWIDGEVGGGLPKGYSHLFPSKWSQKLFCKMDFLRARHSLGNHHFIQYGGHSLGNHYFSQYGVT